MTDTSIHHNDTMAPPFSRPIQLIVAGSLALGGVLTGGPQYLEYLLAGDLERVDQIAWGLDHQAFYRAEWVAGMFGGFLLLLGCLGVWQYTRWRAPRLTAIGAVILTWGLAGQIFSDVGTFTGQVVAADVLGGDRAEQLVADGYLKDPGMIVGVLVPVVAGMFFGVLLLAAACWRSGLPGGAAALLALWPLWDFFGPSPLGPFTTDLLLMGGTVWLAVSIALLSGARWRGRDA